MVGRAERNAGEISAVPVEETRAEGDVDCVEGPVAPYAEAEEAGGQIASGAVAGAGAGVGLIT